MTEKVEIVPNVPYACSFPNISPEALISIASVQNNDAMSPIRTFLVKYHAYPCVLCCLDRSTVKLFHVSSITDYLRDELKHDLTLDYIIGSYNCEKEDMEITSRFSDLGNGIMIAINNIYSFSSVRNPNQLKPDPSDNCFVISSEINIYFLPEHRKFVQDLTKHFYKMTLLPMEPTVTSFTLQMVCHSGCGYYLNSINIKKPLITDLGLHYGKKFLSVHEKIIKSLNTIDEKGIVLLHGIPGSGKTHYIRYLIHEVQNKTLIYVPPDMAKEISAPEFLPFLMQYPNSILIIEDAENIIKNRSESTTASQAVANLLNLSDGLLGDAMHQQIVATFNCDLTTIDPALLRKGRLIANYDFNKLDLESSKNLSDKLGFGTENINEPMTLAEIYNQGETEEQIISDGLK